MTTIDWKALKPHVPLGPGDAQYVERTGSAGDEIAKWILAERSPLLVGGPAGVGKSTELARAAELLQPDRVACLVQLDRFENMRRLTPDRMRLRIAQKVGYLAQQVLHLALSEKLKTELDKVNAELQGETPIIPITRDTTPSALLTLTLKEVMRLSKQGKLTLLIDGLEKVPQGSEGLDLFEALASVRDEVELVLVIPWHAAFGPQAETVIRTGERFVAVRALDVQGDSGEAGREVLRKILRQRLQLAEEALDAPHRTLVDIAIALSGGMPRTFLQLMADAGTYARLRQKAPWPTEGEMSDACADHVDSFSRLFLPGDDAAIREAVGTTGSELDLGRKVRLMAHGILLERMRGGVRVLELHPLAQLALERGGRHA